MRRQIIKVIQDEINPSIANHGGSVELVDFVDRNIFLRLLGGCQGCAASSATLTQGIERILREHFGQDIHEIIDVTDHAAGENPFYS